VCISSVDATDIIRIQMGADGMSASWIRANERKPEHGKKVLVYVQQSNGQSPYMVVGYYWERFKEIAYAHHGEACEFEYCEKSDEFYFKEGWLEQQVNWGEFTSIYVNEGEVTHWTELPEGPVKEKDE